MKKIVLIVLCTAFALSAMAQTKRIAYRSHSGSNAAFALLEDDNLGNPVKTLDIDDSIHVDSSLRVWKDSVQLFWKTYNDSIANPNKAKEKMQQKTIKKDSVNKEDTQKINNKKGEVMDSGKADEKQGGFPVVLLVCLLIPTGFAAAFALRQ